MKKKTMTILVIGFFLLFISVAVIASNQTTITQNSYLSPLIQEQVQQEEAVLSFVSGTEYIPGQEGQVIVEARYRNGTSAIEILGEEYVVDILSSEEYDGVDEDYTPSNTSTINKWEGIETRMDGGKPQSVCALRSIETTANTEGCAFDYNGGDTRYRCGYSGTRAMQRVNQLNSNIVLGGGGRFSISNDDDDAGTMGESYAHLVVADRNASYWQYNVDGEVSCNTPSVYKSEYYGPVGSNGLTFDLMYFRLYEIYDGEFSLIGSSNRSSEFCNNNGFPIYGCSGARNSETVRANFTLYVENGIAIVEFNGENIIETPTRYFPNDLTTYGFVGNRYDPVSSTTVLNVYETIDVYSDDYNVMNITSCIAGIQYPDKEYYKDRLIMFENENGNAYTGFDVPNQEGVYEYQTICDIKGNNQIASKSFHVTDPGISAVVIK